MRPILEIENLKVQFDTDIQRINALNHVSLHVNRGEIVGIIGASGSGKSTLAKAIIGLHASNQETEGKISLKSGDDTYDLGNLKGEDWLKIRGKKATMVFQNPLLNLNPSLTIARHFDHVLASVGKDQKETRIEFALKQVGLDTDSESILSAFPHQLSGGQQQRILIALAILQEVELLILDEPMSSLDIANQDAITKILRALLIDGLSIVLISHDLNVIARLSDRIYVLERGEVVEGGTSTDIMSNPQNVYTQSLVGAKQLGVRSIKAYDTSPILNILGVSHSYTKGGFLSWNMPKIKALADAALSIEKGSVIGLVGPSGSGKSTLVNILLGVESLQQGSIVFQGKSISDYTTKELKRNIQMIPQNTVDALNPKLILEDQLKDVFKLYGSQNAEFQTIISSLLKDVDLSLDLLNRFPSELSGGEIQRMAIVRALIIRPQILVLDESLSALDMLIQKKTLALLHSLNEKTGMTIILISHDDRLISHSCDKVYHFRNGTVSLM